MNAGTLHFTFVFPDGSQQTAHLHDLTDKTDYFHDLFSGMVHSSTIRSMSVSHSPQALKAFLQFLHLGKIEPLPSDFVELFQLSSIYGAPQLIYWLLANTTPSTLVTAVKAIDAFSIRNLPEGFGTLVAECIPVIRESDMRGVSSETFCRLLRFATDAMCYSGDCFQFLCRWARANEMPHVDLSVASLVPFDRMWNEEFEKLVVPCELFTQDVLAELRKKVPTPRDYTILPSSPSLSFECPFQLCFGIATDITTPTTVYVTDCKGNNVHVVDGSSGKFLYSFGERGSAAGQLNGPTGIATADRHRVFVSDTCNHRVQAFDWFGRFLFSFGSQGSGLGQFESPKGLGVDLFKREIHVCDRDNHRINVFSEYDGRFLFCYGSKGSGSGKLNKPTGVAVDGERGEVFVVDFYNPRVSVFKTNGEFVRCFGAKMKGPKGQFGEFGFKSIAIDPQSSHVIVADKDTAKLHVFTRAGEWVKSTGPGSPVLADGLTIGQNGRVYVCCESHREHRVLIF